MLQRNSTERATLEEILCDKWVTNNNKEVIDVNVIETYINQEE